MNELPEELIPVAPGVHWDSKRDTFYVRASVLSPSERGSDVSRLRQAVGAEPDNISLRFLLAGCLEQSGQGEQARAELERVVRSGEATWADKARKALGAEPEQPAT